MGESQAHFKEKKPITNEDLTPYMPDWVEKGMIDSFWEMTGSIAENKPRKVSCFHPGKLDSPVRFADPFTVYTVF